MTCHNSAANFPTTMQLTQNEVGSRIAGKIASGAIPVFHTFADAEHLDVQTQVDLKTPRVKVTLKEKKLLAPRPTDFGPEPKKKRGREKDQRVGTHPEKKRTVFTTRRR